MEVSRGGTCLLLLHGYLEKLFSARLPACLPPPVVNDKLSVYTQKKVMQIEPNGEVVSRGKQARKLEKSSRKKSWIHIFFS